MIKYIFFDLDETLIDIKSAQNDAVKFLYKNYGFEERANLGDFVKKWDFLTDYHYNFYTQKEISYEEQRRRRIVDLFNFYNVQLNEDPIAVYNKYLIYFENSWKAFDDVLPILKLLKQKGYIFGLISNGDYDQQVQKLKKVNIHKFFKYINTSSQSKYSKPNPKLFQTIYESHNIKLNEICYVGNSYKKDYLPSIELGTMAVLLNRNEDKYNDRKLIEIKTLSQLPDLLQNVNKLK